MIMRLSSDLPPLNYW